MDFEKILPAMVGALLAFIVYDMFVKDLIQPKMFDADLN